jgi:release factor glutamine methyltransferase
VLLSHVTGRPRAWLLAHPEAQLSEGEMAALQSGLARLERGEPLPYLLGHWEFYGLDFRVTPATLIPRPETELLVETALAWLRSRPGLHRAADVGTGTGCIAISLAVHCQNLQVTATDVSLAALSTARENAEEHGVSARTHFILSDLFPPTTDQFDLVCANLPYIPSGKLSLLDVYGKEPSLALDGGPDGLDLVRRLLQQAPGRLQPGGLILLEIEAGQGREAAALAQAAFPSAQIQVLPDLAGHDRLVSIQISRPPAK